MNFIFICVRVIGARSRDRFDIEMLEWVNSFLKTSSKAYCEKKRCHHFRLSEVEALNPVARSSCAEVNTEINVPNGSVADAWEGRQKDGNATVDGIPRALVRWLPLPVYNENRCRRKRQQKWDFLAKYTLSCYRDFVLNINQSARSEINFKFESAWSDIFL